MAIVKFQQEQNRGAAGQSMSSPKIGYNFSNLYSLNRGDAQYNNKARKIGQNTMGAQMQVDRFGKSAQENAAAGRDPAQDMSNMALAVEKARQGSQQAKDFNPQVDAIKNGQSAYQAGATGFYAGTSGRQAAKKFTGIYDQVRGTANRFAQDIPGMYQRGLDDKRVSQEKAALREQDRKNKIHEGSQAGYRDTIDEANKGHDPLQRMDFLTWALRTGRISAQEMYQAQKDEKAYERIKNAVNGQNGVSRSGTPGNF